MTGGKANDNRVKLGIPRESFVWKGESDLLID